MTRQHVEDGKYTKVAARTWDVLVNVAQYDTV